MMLLHKDKYNPTTTDEGIAAGLIAGGLIGTVVGSQGQRFHDYIKRRKDPITYEELEVVTPYSKYYRAANFNGYIRSNRQNIITSTAEVIDTYKPKEVEQESSPFGQKDMFTEITHAVVNGNLSQLKTQKSYLEKQKKEGKIMSDDYEFYMSKLNENINSLENSTKSEDIRGKQSFVSSNSVGFMY